MVCLEYLGQRGACSQCSEAFGTSSEALGISSFTFKEQLSEENAQTTPQPHFSA